MMDLAMMGCGTGAVLEEKYISQLPIIRNRLNVSLAGEVGSTPAQDRREVTEVEVNGDRATIHVGDSRRVGSSPIKPCWSFPLTIALLVKCKLR
jgi:ribonucleotide reductase class II